MNSQSETPTLHDEMQQTELGSFIEKNKTPVFVVVFLIIATILGFGFYSVQSDKKNDKLVEKIYNFSQTTLKDFDKSTEDAKKYVDSFVALKAEVGAFDGIAPTGIAMADTLSRNSQNENAITVLESLTDIKSPFIVFFVQTRLAALYEDTGKLDKAIASLELVNQSQLNLLPEKTYLDLGRLYLAQGNKEKAKVNLEYVTKELAQEEFKKLAKYYLEQL